MPNSAKPAYLISNPSGESGALDTLPETKGLIVISKEQLHEQKELRFGKDDKVCLTTESVLDEVLNRLDDEDRRDAVLQLKDKFAFRQLLKSIYPEFYFKQCKLEELPSEIPNNGSRYVIKPVKGCFGTGVRVVDGSVDVQILLAEIRVEMSKNILIFSSEVLTPDEFLIEAYVEGEEYAVDMFYDNYGKPIVTNVYHHPMPSNPAYLHMLYYASREIFEKVYGQAKEFFTKLNTLLTVTNLPIHSEFKMQDGQLIPIELNSFRFGGMGLANLGYHALGVNAYRRYIEDRESDWESVWRDRENIYGFFIAYNGSTTDVAKSRPDWERLREQFTRIILEVPFDYRTQLAFGILFVEEKKERLHEILKIEFDNYFVPVTV